LFYRLVFQDSSNPCFVIKTKFLLAKGNISKATVRGTSPCFVIKTSFLLANGKQALLVFLEACQ
jgi:hypothetical protein